MCIKLQESEVELDEFKFDSKFIMHDYPFHVPAKMPYTKSFTGTNGEKLRNIACNTCKYQMLSNMPGPICGVCGHEMLTVAIVM